MLNVSYKFGSEAEKEYGRRLTPFREFAGPQDVTGPFFIRGGRVSLFRGADCIGSWADSAAALRFVTQPQDQTITVVGTGTVAIAALVAVNVSSNKQLGTISNIPVGQVSKPWMQGLKAGMRVASVVDGVSGQYQPQAYGWSPADAGGLQFFIGDITNLTTVGGNTNPSCWAPMPANTIYDRLPVPLGPQNSGQSTGIPVRLGGGNTVTFQPLSCASGPSVPAVYGPPTPGSPSLIYRMYVDVLVNNGSFPMQNYYLGFGFADTTLGSLSRTTSGTKTPSYGSTGGVPITAFSYAVIWNCFTLYQNSRTNFFTMAIEAPFLKLTEYSNLAMFAFFCDVGSGDLYNSGNGSTGLMYSLTHDGSFGRLADVSRFGQNYN